MDHLDPGNIEPEGSARAPNATLSLRPEQAEDEDLMRRIYASTRAAELEIAPWSDAQKQHFLAMQFKLQCAHFRRHYPGASFSVIMEGGNPAGRLYVNRAEDEIRILDIALLPERRGRGAGTLLLRTLLAEGDNAGIPVRLHVERNNRALRLYERLGFGVIADQGVYLEMEWRRTMQ
ncbi:MAG TPA: GNAT family N-acetyltransferase [Terriglobia bacterium]|nr:GNAT family N-acetyltransferase [Terriglobia bacterium]